MEIVGPLSIETEILSETAGEGLVPYREIANPNERNMISESGYKFGGKTQAFEVNVESSISA